LSKLQTHIQSRKMRKVDMTSYLLNPNRYELRSGSTDDAPNCPYGNKFLWIGYDLKLKEYVRFTKTVFKLLIKKEENDA
jgi:hypothetical protein